MNENTLDFILELQRLPKTINKMLMVMPPEEQKRHKAQLTWFFKKADEFIASNGFSFVACEGVYDVGLPYTPLNLSDFDKDAVLVIDQVIEPTIMHNGKVVKTGTVLLKKAE
ncbi:MAG: hypothetical protein IKW57_04190 [Alphaproteobacteria bacterium]|nr:hypothetical protein [Alphaproteobacteria bacterium]